MSSFDQRSAAARRLGGIAAAIVLAGALSVLAGCGFQPLYGKPGGASGIGATDQLAAVRVAPLPDRAGQQMHNLLRDRLNPQGQPIRPRYLLEVRLHELRENLGIRVDETATRANLTVVASFALRESGTGELLYRSDARSTNSFNILTSQFATDVAENDARERALRELADSIRTRLGIYFSRRDSGEI